MNTVALTYRELAEKLDIKLESARRTAQRKKWTRSVGNDGTVRIHVPVEYIPVVSTVHTTVDTTETSSVTLDSAVRIATLEAEVVGLRDLLESERKRTEAAERRGDEWKALAERPWWKRLV